MQTPGQADKSFKISDFFFDTPTLNQTDLNTLLAAENDNKENDPIFANFGTPLNHRSRFFKTPLKEFSNTPRLIGSTSVKKLSLSATSETPSRSNYKTPLKPNHQQSSPSTIIMTSTKKFQIIFADMNTLKGNYSGSKQKKQKKLARSTTTNSVSTAQTKKQAITDSDVTHNDSNYKKQKN
ncbi:hypothetical protein CANARDRAFT_187120, partial [[Candida] arabinofermentans NRRL YB-2248]